MGSKMPLNCGLAPAAGPWASSGGRTITDNENSAANAWVCNPLVIGSLRERTI